MIITIPENNEKTETKEYFSGSNMVFPKFTIAELISLKKVVIKAILKQSVITLEFSLRSKITSKQLDIINPETKIDIPIKKYKVNPVYK